MFKKMKLAPKLALTIGSVLTVILIFLIGITVTMSKKAISTSTFSELNEISESNALQVQQIFDEAESVALDMQYFLEHSFQQASENPSWNVIPTHPAAKAVFMMRCLLPLAMTMKCICGRQLEAALPTMKIWKAWALCLSRISFRLT